MILKYKIPFTLTEPISNNAFNFGRRVVEVGEPCLHVPSVVEGALDDVQIGDQVVFEDFDEHDQLQSCIGLKNFVKLPHLQTSKPMVVVDNHNHVFWFWYEAWHRGLIDRGITLVHIDAHRDTRIPERNPTPEETQDLQKLYTYTNSILNVGNYIPPSDGRGFGWRINFHYF